MNDVREIRRIGDSLPRAELARRFATTPSNISAIIRRISWAWLPDEPEAGSE